MMENVRRKHPQVKIVATTLREVLSTNRHRWAAVAWMDGHAYVRPRANWTSLTGWGAATVTRLASSTVCWPGVPEQEAVNLGWAHGALLTTFRATPRWPRSTR